MRRISIGLLLAACLAGWPTPAQEDEGAREAVWRQVDLSQELPADLLDPEGKTRWELRSLPLAESHVRTVETRGGVPERLSSAVRLTVDSGPLRSASFVDPSGGRDAERWLLPDRVPGELERLRGEPIQLLREEKGKVETWRIHVERAGLGWAMLPSGPREVFLQRALVLRSPAGERAFRPHRLIHRWVDPRAGIVAEVGGPVSGDGKRRLAVGDAAVVEEMLRGAKGLQIYADHFATPPFVRLRYGYDMGDGVLISSLTTPGHANAGALVGATSWDFSGNISTTEIASTKTDIDSTQTCSWDQCGFTIPGVTLSREDTNFDDPDPSNQIRTFTAVERVEQAGVDVTYWLRAGVSREGQTGLLDGESRFCHIGIDDDGVPRPEVPLWRAEYDGATGEYYLENGDSWTHPTFDCVASIFPHVCPEECSCGIIFCFCPIRLAACSGHDGTQSTWVINEGPVTLPSGHTFNSLLVRSVADFCTYFGDDLDCSNSLEPVKTVVLLWEVPNIGTVVRLTSDTNVPDVSSYTTLAETDIKYGLFPPLSITVTGVTDTSVSLSWDPGAQNRIDKYKVYWDPESGSLSPYDNSVIQDVSAGTSATIDGLCPGTEYFFTVTTISDYCDVAACDPVSGSPTTRYESALFPITAPASPDPIPAEVGATTSGSYVPTTEVASLHVEPAGGGEIEICWSTTSEPCLEGYQILGADSPESDVNFSAVVEDTGLTTCHTFDPSESYFLVVGKGSGGTGPWGHYDH
jgi:hypothetical protein